MKRLVLVPARWTNAPAAIVGIVVFLVLAGVGVIIQNEAAYRDLQTEETRVQAEILAASVTAALDFGDAQAAREAVSAERVNRRIRTVGIYDARGRLVAGYGRDGADPAPNVSAIQPTAASINSLVPVISAGERIGSVYLAADPEPLSRRLTRYLVVFLLVAMAALVVAVLGVAQSALRRANRELGERALALGEANAQLKVQIEERARAEEQLRQAQKLQALGQLTGGIAHDFNNLLTVIQGSADMLRRPGVDEKKRVRFAEAIVQAATRAAALTGQLLAFARRQPLQPEAIDINELIVGMADLMDRTLGERIEIRTRLAPGLCSIEADRAQLESALLNIAVNGRDAMPEGGALTITTGTAAPVAGRAMLAIAISDEGTGMDDETLSRAIEPFFTTKVTGKGTGLGLSQVYGFATQSGGDVDISSTPGEGTTVTLLLPCSAAAVAEHGTERVGRLESRRRGKILLVEDNEEVGEFAEILLRELGHEVVRARSGEEALELAAGKHFDAVLSDVVMPGMSGLELAEELEKRQPGLAVLLTTGYSDEIAESGTGGWPVILKPYRLDALADAIDGVMGAR